MPTKKIRTREISSFVMSSKDLTVLENETIELSQKNNRFARDISVIKPKTIDEFKQIIGTSEMDRGRRRTKAVVDEQKNFISPNYLKIASDGLKKRNLKAIAHEYAFGDSESLREYVPLLNAHIVPNLNVVQASLNDIVIEPNGRLIARVDLLTARNITIKKNGMLMQGRDSLTINCNRIEGGYHPSYVGIETFPDYHFSAVKIDQSYAVHSTRMILSNSGGRA